MKQKTLRRSVTLSGNGLHTGLPASIVVSPAPEEHGLVFYVRNGGSVAQIPVSLDYVDDCVRATSLSKDGIKIHTVEHLLSACYSLGITNARIECDGCEIPILDGSAKPWVEAFLSVGLETQSAEAACWEITEPISIVKEDRSIMMLPYDGLKITCTSTDDRKTHTQHLSLDIDADGYERELASARTFCTYEDIEPLIQAGKIKGGTLDCAVVIKGDRLLSNEPLRYPDEFVRHKILDILGDLALLGHAVKGHVIAIKTGHALNIALAKAIRAQEEPSLFPLTACDDSAALDIYEILKHLPHRYPFVMVDRVLTLGEDTIVAVKNITMNEPCFTGHFPENPVFPGVLQLEAMAQTAGLLLGSRLGGSEGYKQAFFMSADKVKFRQIVQPGDQLRIEVKLLKIKNNRIGYAEGQCFVKDKVVSSAELMFMMGNR